MTCAFKIQCDFILNVKVTVFFFHSCFFFLLTPRDREPADITWLVVGSINPEAYKSKWYTVYCTVSRKISLIYVIGNWSNAILLNYVCFSSSRVCISDLGGQLRLPQSCCVCHPGPLSSTELGLLACLCVLLSVGTCSVLRSEGGIEFQGFFMNKIWAPGTQEKNRNRWKQASQPVSWDYSHLGQAQP